MIIIEPSEGRLCNHIIKYLIAYLISVKYNFSIILEGNHKYKEEIGKLGFNFYESEKNINYKIKQGDNKKIFLNNNNFIDILKDKKNDYQSGVTFILSRRIFYQNPEGIAYIVKYFNNLNNTLCQNIINTNPFKDRYNNNNDMFIHYRNISKESYRTSHIKDIPGLDYYEKIIKKYKNNIDNIFICSDNIKSNIIDTLVNKYNIKILNLSSNDTILFGSTCKHVLLSSGSFSFTIGILSFYSYLYYDKNAGKKWHPQYFSKFIHKDNSLELEEIL